jgi:hypothetical protein
MHSILVVGEKAACGTVKHNTQTCPSSTVLRIHPQPVRPFFTTPCAPLTLHMYKIPLMLPPSQEVLCSHICGFFQILGIDNIMLESMLIVFGANRSIMLLLLEEKSRISRSLARSEMMHRSSLSAAMILGGEHHDLADRFSLTYFNNLLNNREKSRGQERLPESKPL